MVIGHRSTMKCPLEKCPEKVAQNKCPEKVAQNNLIFDTKSSVAHWIQNISIAVRFTINQLKYKSSKLWHLKCEVHSKIWKRFVFWYCNPIFSTSRNAARFSLCSAASKLAGNDGMGKLSLWTKNEKKIRAIVKGFNILVSKWIYCRAPELLFWPTCKLGN